MTTAFENFFAGPFQNALDQVGDEPGALTGDVPLREASWDRKAAWLLFTALGHVKKIELSVSAEDLLG
jgi:hypothetical protein